MIEGTDQSTETTSRQYSDSDEVCSECHGTGTKLIEGKGAVLCPCRRSDPSKKLLENARIPKRYRECSFDNFKSEPGTLQDNALLYAKTLVLDYPAVDRGLLLMGPAGVGKTHLAVAHIKRFIPTGFVTRCTKSSTSGTTIISSQSLLPTTRTNRVSQLLLRHLVAKGN